MIDPVAFAQDLIQCPSVTPADEGAQDVLIKALTPLGFTAHDVTRGDVRNTFLRLGSESPHICFCGHTDVVPVGDEASWSVPPFDAVIKDNRLYGRGASDMKGNIACFVAALSEYLENEKPKGSISLLITGDEEGIATHGTVKVLEWMEEEGHVPDFAIVGEPTNPQNLGEEIKIGRRGSLTGELTVKGVQGHVAYPKLADNPLPRLIKLADALSSHTFDQDNEFFLATNLEFTTIDTGNKADNVIPAKASARFNVRFNDTWSAATLEQKIRDLLDGVSTEYGLECWSNAESFLTKPNELTNLVVDAVEEITGKRPAMTTTGGTSDARFVQNYCPVVECGLINKTIHQIDEYTEIKDMAALTKIYAGILKRYFAL